MENHDGIGFAKLLAAMTAIGFSCAVEISQKIFKKHTRTQVFDTVSWLCLVGFTSLGTNAPKSPKLFARTTYMFVKPSLYLIRAL